jgi:PEGA domain
VPISVSEEEAKYIPTGVATNTVKEPEKEDKETKAEESSEEKTTCKLKSFPDGADIYADDAFVGNTPAQLKLSAGKHHIRVVMKGYEEWSKDIDVPAGSEITLNAILVKSEN